MPSTTGGISPSQTTEISQSLYYEYHELSTVDDCANFYLRSFISCAHYCGFPACCSYPSRFSTEGGCCGGALGRRVASQAGRPGRGPLFLFIIKLSHEYAKPSAFAVPISCYRSMAAITPRARRRASSGAPIRRTRFLSRIRVRSRDHRGPSFAVRQIELRRPRFLFLTSRKRREYRRF